VIGLLHPTPFRLVRAAVSVAIIVYLLLPDVERVFGIAV
jgi:antibiotic biosynthesis monooxygenase (ABM) superfamily enzyme